MKKSENTKRKTEVVSSLRLFKLNKRGHLDFLGKEVFFWELRESWFQECFLAPKKFLRQFQREAVLFHAMVGASRKIDPATEQLKFSTVITCVCREFGKTYSRAPNFFNTMEVTTFVWQLDHAGEYLGKRAVGFVTGYYGFRTPGQLHFSGTEDLDTYLPNRLEY